MQGSSPCLEQLNLNVVGSLQSTEVHAGRGRGRLTQGDILIYKVNSMLNVVVARATRMPASPAAWSSSSSTSSFGDGGVGGGGGRVMFANGVITVWQLAPSYPASHDVHVHDPTAAPTAPPSMQLNVLCLASGVGVDGGDDARAG